MKAALLPTLLLDAVAAVWLRLWRPISVARWLMVMNLAVSLSMVALAGLLLWDMRNDAWRRAQQASTNLLEVLSRDIARNIEIYDASLKGTIVALKNPLLAGLDPTLRRMALFDYSASAEYLGAIIVADATGNIVDTSLDMKGKSMSVRDREHFQVHQQRSDVGLFISRVFEARVIGGNVIALTRRFDAPDGRFGGIVEGVIRTSYFSDMFRKLELPRNGSVTLFHSNGRIIMRWPLRPQDINVDLSNDATFRQVYRAPQGTVTGVSPLDGVTRVFNFRHIDGLPLIVASGVPEAAIYAEWWRKALGIGAVLLVLIAASVALSLLVRRELQRRLKAESALVEAAKRLTAAAATDGLTGIPNRRSFEDAMAREWRRAIRTETGLAVLLVDVDCFKLFNDRYGHQPGDEVLQRVARCLDGSVRRPADLAARYGGEEFIALLPETDLTGAMAVAEGMRSAVAALGIPHEGSPLGAVTVSIGVAIQRPQLGQTSPGLIKQADEALYQSKRDGRNRVTVHATCVLQATLAEDISLAPLASAV